LESSRQGLQLFFGPHLNLKFAQNVMGLQSCKNPNFGTPKLKVFRENDIWVLAS